MILKKCVHEHAVSLTYVYTLISKYVIMISLNKNYILFVLKW